MVEAIIRTNPKNVIFRKVVKMLPKINVYSPNAGNLELKSSKFVHPKMIANIPTRQKSLE